MEVPEREGKKGDSTKIQEKFPELKDLHHETIFAYITEKKKKSKFLKGETGPTRETSAIFSLVWLKMLLFMEIRK